MDKGIYTEVNSKSSNWDKLSYLGKLEHALHGQHMPFGREISLHEKCPQLLEM